MNTAAGLFFGLLGVAAFYACIMGTLMLCECFAVWRQQIRDFVVDEWSDLAWRWSQRGNPKIRQRWSFATLRWWEIAWYVLALVLLLLTWLVVELLAALGQLIIGAILMAVTYSIARDVRDWWHNGKAH